MIRSTAVLIAVLSLAACLPCTRRRLARPGTAEVTSSRWREFFTSGDRASEFRNYNSRALTYKSNRIVGVEGEVVARSASRRTPGWRTDTNMKSPNTLAYTGNVVLSLRRNRRLFRSHRWRGRPDDVRKGRLGINSAETFSRETPAAA